MTGRIIGQLAKFTGEGVVNLLPLRSDAKPTLAVNVGGLRLLECQIALLKVML